MTFEAVTKATTMSTIFRDMAFCSAVEWHHCFGRRVLLFHLEDGDRRYLQNISIYLLNHTSSQSGRFKCFNFYINYLVMCPPAHRQRRRIQVCLWKALRLQEILVMSSGAISLVICDHNLEQGRGYYQCHTQEHLLVVFFFCTDIQGVLQKRDYLAEFSALQISVHPRSTEFRRNLLNSFGNKIFGQTDGRELRYMFISCTLCKERLLT
jgi:hypothetical protein